MDTPEAQATRAYDAALLGTRQTRGAVAAPRPSKASLPGVGDVVGGHYRLVRRIGEGTFGRVFLAQRVDMPAHQVALKLVAREVFSGRDVARELVMLASASHPNIVQLKDHGITERYVWLTMPVYEGETLSARLERGPLDLAEAHAIFAPIARALEALHKAGLRHQDVKPDNLFLARFAGRLHPVLLDLGVAAPHGATFVAGTLLYAAPEQIRALDGDHKHALSEKLDTYGLATTLLSALVPPERFPGEDASTRGDIGLAHAVRAARPLASDVLVEATGAPRARLIEAFRRWLALDPAARPDMTQLADEIDVLLGPAREREKRAGLRRVRRTRAARAVIGALGVALLASGGFAYFHRETLRLARELERARAQGEDSFDRLDTCVAAHRVAEREASTCAAARERDKNELHSAVERIATGLGSDAERARSLVATYAARARSCEEDSERLQKAYGRDRQRLAAEADAERERASTERDAARRALDEQQRLTAERASALATAEQELAKSRAEVVACAEQRASVEAAASALAKAVAGRPQSPRGPTASRKPTAPRPTAESSVEAADVPSELAAKPPPDLE